MAPSGYRLMPNDVIKLGRVRFKVREIISPAYTRKSTPSSANNSKLLISPVILQNEPLDFNKNQEIHYSPDIRLNQSISALRMGGPTQEDKSQHIMILRSSSHGSNKSSNQQVCRICLSEEEDAKLNPLFSPCKCSGTMKYIHLQCLQEWLNSRMITKETVSTKTFYWKDLNCELCKTAFPNYVKSPWQEEHDKDISLHVVNYEKPSYTEEQTPAYLVLESITNAQGKVIHVVDMSKCEEAKIGRGNDVDVRITDISVSRLHALIKKTPKGYFFVQDNKSKFGTLTLIRSPIMLHPTEPNFIQAGRTMLEMQTRLPVKIWTSCFCNGTVKQKKKINNSGLKKRQQHFGLTTINGIDYFPEDFLNIKAKYNKKEEDDNLQQIENLENYLHGNTRPLSSLRPAENVSLNQVHPLPFNPLPISAELIQQLNLIREESLDINYSLGPSVLEQRAASSMMQPSYFSVQQALQAMQGGGQGQQDTEQQQQQVNERNMINMIQAELENSLSRLMEEHQKSGEFDFDQSDIRHNGSVDRASSPFVNGNFMNIQEEIKEIDEASISNDPQSNHNLHRAMQSITPIRAQNFFASPSVGNIQKQGGNYELRVDTNMNNKVLQQMETDGDLKNIETHAGGMQKGGQKHVLVENQSLPTGRFVKHDILGGGLVGGLNESPSKELDIGFSNIFPTHIDVHPREPQYPSPYHNPLATTFLQEDFKTIEFRGDQQSLIQNSPFPQTTKNEQLSKVQSSGNTYRNSINPQAQAKNQRILQNGSNYHRLSLPSKIAPIESHFTINAGHNLFSPADSSVRKSSQFNSPVFRPLEGQQRTFLEDTNQQIPNLQHLVSATSDDFILSPQHSAQQHATFQMPSQRQLESIPSAHKSGGAGNHKDSNIKRMQAIASSYGVDMPKGITNSGNKKQK
ncbi:hypothetical protein FGO68_gene11599 [Halteria grandinella]|uniref:Uncharacterized protein n=1 Tax=Halteria grandinella TaxID=5974 RepID=A0A8J8NFN6_HALGN|nr:hypothetical protein FGO68_gene11599 [Halteria grandinella]